MGKWVDLANAEANVRSAKALEELAKQASSEGEGLEHRYRQQEAADKKARRDEFWARLEESNRQAKAERQERRQAKRDARRGAKKPSPGPLSPREALTELAGLHDEGLITEQEFQAKRAEILGRM